MDTKFKNALQEEALKYCVGLAYGDLRRTLQFTDEANDKDKADFRNKMYGLIIGWIKHDIFSHPEHFNKKHKEICNNIITEANEAKNGTLFESFYLGQAQKWLNMTLKNILLLNLCSTEMTDELIASLHVPVDSIIIKLAWDEFDEVVFPQIGTTRPTYLKGKNQGKPKYETAGPWSRWDDYDDYFKFQDSLKNAISGLNKYKSPIEWEFYAWREATANQPDELKD